ncbi:MAG: hypothetical protein AAGA56_29455, partial [Myxococcota bacterium]
PHPPPGRPLVGALPAPALSTLPAWKPAMLSAAVGALQSLRDAERLVASFDEDWYRNPRAAAALEAEDAAAESGSAHVDPAELREGADHFVDGLEALLG